MSAKIVTVCDALVSYLNGLTLSQAFTAERQNIWVEDMADSDAYRVVVVPLETETTIESRSASQRRFRVNVIVQKRLLSGNDLADSDACLELMEEIEDALYGIDQGGFSFNQFDETVGSRSFLDIDAALGARAFRSVLQISYWGP